MRNNNVTILGTGSYLPSRIVSNSEICENIDTTPDWVEQKLGISERRMVETETTSDLAYYAALRALESSGVDKEDLDLIYENNYSYFYNNDIDSEGSKRGIIYIFPNS